MRAQLAKFVHDKAEADALDRELDELLAQAPNDPAVVDRILDLLARIDVEWTAEFLSGGPPLDVRGTSGSNERGQTPAVTDSMIRRTPHLDTPERLPTTPGASFTVKVWTDQASARTGEESEDVVIEAPAGVQTVTVGVLLITSPHLAAEGSYFEEVTIERDLADSRPVEFNVVVTEKDAPGPVTLTAQFSYRGLPCGRVRREWEWPSGSSRPLETSVTGVPLHIDTDEPDVTVLVTATGAGRYACSVRVPKVLGREPTPPAEWPGVLDPEAVSNALHNLVNREIKEVDRQRALVEAGRLFWDAAPPVFRDILWKLIDLRDKDEMGSKRAVIYVATDEPVLPWEIMWPSRPRHGAADEDRGDPLGVEFAVGRWVRGADGTPPPPTLPVRDSLLIAASYEGDDALNPEIEWNVLQQHFNGRQLKEATYKCLDEFLQKNTASLLHFVCHGDVDQDDTKIYFDGFEGCTSAALRENKGLNKACASTLPIVFLNACYAGASRPSLGPGGRGFPKAFIQMGARAVIAPLWPVSKDDAPKVAKEIYERSLTNPEKSLAEILAELRSQSYEEADEFQDSWAAYCLFGNPNATLVRG